MPQVIVSYDGTRNDRDALALGALFAHAARTSRLRMSVTAPRPTRNASRQRKQRPSVCWPAALRCSLTQASRNT
jgi:hypothetical protein